MQGAAGEAGSPGQVRASPWVLGAGPWQAEPAAPGRDQQRYEFERNEIEFTEEQGSPARHLGVANLGSCRGRGRGETLRVWWEGLRAAPDVRGFSTCPVPREGPSVAAQGAVLGIFVVT